MTVTSPEQFVSIIVCHSSRLAFCRLDAEREAGVVDEHVECREFGGKRGLDGLDGGAVAHVELERQQRVAEFGGERVETILRRAVATTRWPP